MRMFRSRRWIAGMAVALAGAAFGALAAASPSKMIARVDLAKPFGAPSPWRLVVTQGPDVPGWAFPDETAPGLIRLCVQKGPAGSCDTQLLTPARPWAGLEDDAWEPHYLREAQVVYPLGRAAPPLLLVKTASMQSGDGDQFVFTQLFAYRPDQDRFARVYSRGTGHNNNQEVRFVASGPLAGSVISAEPTEKAPFGFWITVNRLTPAYAYEQALRYRSATTYADGNPLAVIDSEMPNIEQRLGLWAPGQPLPTPARCAKPRLVKLELWCGDPR